MPVVMVTLLPVHGAVQLLLRVFLEAHLAARDAEVVRLCCFPHRRGTYALLF